MTLTEMRDEAHRLNESFLEAVRRVRPDFGAYHWYRALSASRGENVRRNTDTSCDAALASSVEIRAAHDAYIVALHAFYRARDGEGGVLGGRA